jgi:hypothetical protein
MVAEEVIAGLAGGVVRGVTKKIVSEMIEDFVEKLSRDKGIIATVIYFTIFKPKIFEDDIERFITSTINKIGGIKSFEEEPFRDAIHIGKSRFWLWSSITKIRDVIFYETLFSELINAIEGEEKYQETELDKELVKELGVKEDALEEINDVTLVICPDPERVRVEDVHLLIKTLFDEAVIFLASQRIALKIKIFGYKKERALNAIEGRLRRLGVLIYRGEKSEEKPVLTVVPTPSQALEKGLYEAIYSKGRWLF